MATSGKSACRITTAIREEVAASIRYAETSWRSMSGKNRRSAAKAMARAEKLVRTKASRVWTATQKKKIGDQVLDVMGTLYSGGAPVDVRTMKKTVSLLADLDIMARRTC